MCSMGFAPKSGGEVLPYRFAPPEYKGVNLDADSIGYIRKLAHNFWESVASDARISKELKAFLERGNPIDLTQSIAAPK
jgi:hypothetical protein